MLDEKAIAACKAYVDLNPISYYLLLETQERTAQKAFLTQLNINSNHWIYLTRDFESPFKTLVGSAHHIRQARKQLGKA